MFTALHVPSHTSPALGMVNGQLQDSVIVVTASELNLCSKRKEASKKSKKVRARVREGVAPTHMLTDPLGPPDDRSLSINANISLVGGPLRVGS